MALRKYAYLLILLALIALKVSSSALHMYLHHADDHEHIDECELCEHAIYSQNAEFSTPTVFHDVKVDFIITFLVTIIIIIIQLQTVYGIMLRLHILGVIL